MRLARQSISNLATGILAICVWATALLWTVAYAPPATSQELEERLGAKDRQQILSDMAQLIETHYIDPQKAARVAKALTTRKAKKRLAFDTRVAFAREASALLFELSGDRHLSLKCVEEFPATANAPGGTPTAPSTSHGIRKVEFLPGNVGLLTIDRFHETLTARETLTAALLILRSSDALIFDFRDNRGGASDTVRLLQSCFFPEPTLVMYYEDEPGVLTPSLSEAPPAAISCLNKPFYVLISEETASAAEDFVYTAQLKKHGTLVGERTSGAANFVNHHYLTGNSAGRFRLAVSVGRPVHPETRTNWEGEGIMPDVEVAAPQALDMAYDMALEDLLSVRPGGRLQFHHNAAHGALYPTHLSSRDLKGLTGRYDGIRIELSLDGLTLRRQSGVLSKLRPLAPETFSVQDDTSAQVLFHTHDIGVTYVELLYSDGARELFGLPE